MAIEAKERRRNLRFDKVFTVYLATADGITRGIGRNISGRGMFVETQEPIPLGGQLRATLTAEDGTEMTCLCEVRSQVALIPANDDANQGFIRRIHLPI